jgi:hypothetical protein
MGKNHTRRMAGDKCLYRMEANIYSGRQTQGLTRLQLRSAIAYLGIPRLRLSPHHSARLVRRGRQV